MARLSNSAAPAWTQTGAYEEKAVADDHPLARFARLTSPHHISLSGDVIAFDLRTRLGFVSAVPGLGRRLNALTPAAKRFLSRDPEVLGELRRVLPGGDAPGCVRFTAAEDRSRECATAHRPAVRHVTDDDGVVAGLRRAAAAVHETEAGGAVEALAAPLLEAGALRRDHILARFAEPGDPYIVHVERFRGRVAMGEHLLHSRKEAWPHQVTGKPLQDVDLERLAQPARAHGRRRLKIEVASDRRRAVGEVRRHDPARQAEGRVRIGVGRLGQRLHEAGWIDAVVIDDDDRLVVLCIGEGRKELCRRADVVTADDPDHLQVLEPGRNTVGAVLATGTVGDVEMDAGRRRRLVEQALQRHADEVDAAWNGRQRHDRVAACARHGLSVEVGKIRTRQTRRADQVRDERFALEEVMGGDRRGQTASEGCERERNCKRHGRA